VTHLPSNRATDNSFARRFAPLAPHPPHSLQPVNFAMPPCPIAAVDLSTPFDYVLPAESPTKGVKVSAKGSLEFKDAAGNTVLSGSIDVTVQ